MYDVRRMEMLLLLLLLLHPYICHLFLLFLFMCWLQMVVSSLTDSPPYPWHSMTMASGIRYNPCTRDERASLAFRCAKCIQHLDKQIKNTATTTPAEMKCANKRKKERTEGTKRRKCKRGKCCCCCTEHRGHTAHSNWSDSGIHDLPTI